MAQMYNESGGATGATFLDFLKAQFGMMKDTCGNELNEEGVFFT